MTGVARSVMLAKTICNHTTGGGLCVERGRVSHFETHAHIDIVPPTRQNTVKRVSHNKREGASRSHNTRFLETCEQRSDEIAHCMRFRLPDCVQTEEKYADYPLTSCGQPDLITIRTQWDFCASRLVFSMRS